MPDTSEGDPVWERRIIEKLALEALAEQKRRRRWGIFFKILGFAYQEAHGADPVKRRHQVDG